MRIATFQWKGRRHVGIVEGADGVPGEQAQVRVLALDPGDARRGALPLVEAAAEGRALPAPSGDIVPLAQVTLEAPLPLPRRNVFCVGRNYHAHARELSGTVFKSAPAKTDQWPIVFTKVPECVVGPARS